MKVAHKVGLVASAVLLIAVGLLSWNQYQSVKNILETQSRLAMQEETQALTNLVANWLKGKLGLIDLVAQNIDTDFSAATIQRSFDSPLLKSEFLLIFGGLKTDGKAITNDPSWNPNNWDARKRPWWQDAVNNNQAVMTKPYPDAETGEILISAVAKLSDKGQLKGAFGGDLSLAAVSKALNAVSFNNTGYALLMDKDGTIISHPDEQFNGKKISSLFDGQAPGLASEPKYIATQDKHLYVAFKPVEGLPGMNWYVGAVLDADLMFAEVKALGWRAVIGVIIGVIASMLVLVTVMQRLLKPLTELQHSLREINSGDGDLTQRLPVTSNDEFGQVAKQFNQFIASLQQLLSSVKALSSEVKGSTESTSNEATNSSRQLHQQLGELDQLATAMTQMASSADEVAGNAQRAAEAAGSAETAVEHGVQTVSQTTQAIEKLASEMEGAVTTVNEMARFSANIESILQVITGIADQTNLLALNAAIEAARAGESGRGFAVVADEVRSLASRTQESTSEIRDMIDQLQSGVSQAVQMIERSQTSANQTAQDAVSANDVLAKIQDAIGQINEMNLQIAAAAEQQSSTTEEINRNTTNIRDISQSVVNGAEKQMELCQEVVTQVNEQEKHLGLYKA